jgi:ABC-type glycerol-3-phosphate transport system substrate-binding protein
VEKPVEKVVKETVVVEKVIKEAAGPLKVIEFMTTEERHDIPGFEDVTVEGTQYLRGLCQQYYDETGIMVKPFYHKSRGEWWATRLAAGDVPDMSIEALSKGGVLAGQGALLEVPMDKVQADKFVPGILDIFSQRGKLWGLPLHQWVIQCVPFRDAWREYGVDELLPDPNGPRTWSLADWEAGVREITKQGQRDPNKEWGTIFGGANYQYMPFLTPFGSKVFEPGDRSKFAINTDETVQALEFIKGLYDDKVIPDPTFEVDYWEYTVSRKMGVVYEDSGWATREWESPDFSKAPEGKAFDAYGVAIPTAPGVDAAPLAMGPTGFIFFNKDNLEECVDFANWLSEPGRAEVLIGTRQGARIDHGNAHNHMADFEWLAGYLPSVGAWDLGHGLGGYGKIYTALKSYLNQAVLGAMTPQQALDAFEAEATAYLTIGQ